MDQVINNLSFALGPNFVLGPVELLTISLSILLFVLARPILSWLKPSSELGTQISMMRILSFLIVVGVIINAWLFKEAAWATSVIYSLIVIYFAILGAQIINFLIRRRFGKARTSNDKTTYSDTYASRGLSLIATGTIGVIALVSCLRILGLDSLLEAGGAIGIIGLILAMTQASWAPDIISGLIILNSRFCEDGDVIQFNMNGENIIASVFKTKIFHTEVLDLKNNHRIMVRNAKLRDFGVQNLSRFASARGLREVLYFNIDYQHSEEEVTSMIKRAFAKIDESEGAREEQYEPEIRVHDTGDYAVTWAVYYYIKDVKRLLSIRQLFRRYILAESMRSGISLATPILQQNEIHQAQPDGELNKEQDKNQIRQPNIVEDN